MTFDITEADALGAFTILSTSGAVVVGEETIYKCGLTTDFSRDTTLIIGLPSQILNKLYKPVRRNHENFIVEYRPRILNIDYKAATLHRRVALRGSDAPRRVD